MSLIEKEIQHNIAGEKQYADLTKGGVEEGLKSIGRATTVFWHGHSLQYQPGIGYIEIQHPSPMDRFLDRLLGGSRSIPRVVRRLPIR